jgi:hypothetical protein
MSEEIVTQEVTEQTYIYQPTDNDGRPIGGKQVIKYSTPEELVKKLEEQNILLIRKLREQTKKVRLGIEEKEELPDDVVRFSGPVEFSPRELSDDERYDIARRLADPTTSSQAAQELVEASIGAPLKDLGNTLQTMQQDNINLRAKIEANAFTADNPEYYRCSENFESITSWMVRYDLAPIKANFQKAYDTLKAQGLLVEGPAPIPVIPVVEEGPVVAVEPVPVVHSRVATGLTRDDASDAGVPVKAGSDLTYVVNGRTYTGLAAVSAMPSDEYKRRLLTDKNFAKQVDKLEADSKKRGA